MIKKVAVLGAGAIGGITGALLFEKGVDVVLLDTNQEHVDAVQKNGLHLDGLEKDRFVKVPIFKDPAEANCKFDMVILAVKNIYNKAAIPAILPYLTKDGFILSVQNGIPEDELFALAGKDKIVSGMTGWGGTNVGPGHLTKTTGGIFEIGEYMGKPSPRVMEAADILRKAFEVKIVPFMLILKWYKLFINASMSGVGAISGYLYGDTLAHEDATRLALKIITEAYDVSQKADIPFPSKGLAPFPTPDKLTARSEPTLEKAVSTLKMLLKDHHQIKSSVLQDLEKGVKTEIDYWNGYISTVGKKLGVETPVNDAITRMVKEIEAGTRQITPDNIKELKDAGLTKFHQNYYEGVMEEYKDVTQSIFWPNASIGFMLSDTYSQPFFPPGSPKWDIPEPFVLKIAACGAYIMPNVNPNQPLTQKAINEQVEKCIDLGACSCHIHVRDDNGMHTLDLSRFHEVIDNLREKYGRENLLIDGCPEGGKDFIDTCGPLIEFKDEWETCPLTCAAVWLGNLLFIPSTSLATQGMGKIMEDLGIKPEMVCHDLGDIDNARRWLIETGIVKKPYYFRLSMGQTGWGTVTNPRALMDTYRQACDRILEIDPDAKVMVSMSGRAGIWGVMLAAMYGPPIIGARIGMEDSIWMRPTDDEVIKDNPSIMKNLIKGLEFLGRRPATANEYREMLGLPKVFDKK
jgi:2-dehydropantoate 2-reductase